MPAQHRAGHGQCHHRGEGQAWRARPDRAAEGRRLPRHRFPAGERDPARVRAAEGGPEGKAGWAAGRLSLTVVPREKRKFVRGNELPLAHVAAARIVERGRGEIDPVGGSEIADRDRLVFLQRHEYHLAIFGRLPFRERDALDLVAFADNGLERLLLLREAVGGRGYQKKSDGKRAPCLHGILLVPNHPPGCGGYYGRARATSPGLIGVVAPLDRKSV